MLIQFKDKSEKNIKIQKRNDIQLDINHSVMMIKIYGEWDTNLLVDGEAKNFVNIVYQNGYTLITFKNCGDHYHSKRSLELSVEQCLHSLNFCRVESAYLILKNRLSGETPDSVQVEWWDYMSFEPSTLTNLYAD